MKWKMSKSYTEYLRHIFDECNFIIKVVPQELTKEEFLNDDVLKRAVVRSLEIIVWDVIKNKIPSLTDQIAKVIQEHE